MPLKTVSHRIVSQIRKDFDLDSGKSHHFYKSEWELLDNGQGDSTDPTVKQDELSTTTAAFISDNEVSLKFLIYRGLYMTILISSITFSTTCQSRLFHIFLTNWSFTAQNLYSVLFFISVFWRWWAIRRKKGVKCNTNNRKIVENGNDGFRNNLELVPSKGSSSNGDLAKNCAENSDNSVSKWKLVFHTQPQVLTPKKQDVECCYEKMEKDGDGAAGKLTFLEKSIWILMNIVHVLPYCVVLGYWCFVYKYDPDQPYCEKFRSHYIVHAATAILAFIDTLVIAIPARISHFLIPSGLLLLYVTFTFLYEIGGGEYREGKPYIYSVLDWKEKPLKALAFSVIGVFVSPLAHFGFCWGIHRLRLLLVKFYRQNKSTN